MTLLRYVAMGLVVVFVRADFGGWDALADPVGWGLVIGALWRLRTRLSNADTLLWLASLALLVSLVTYPPAVADRLSASGSWGVSLPQTVFCLVLCGSLAALARPAGDAMAGRARWLDLLRWVYVAVALGPVLVLGGGVAALTTPVAVLAVLANVALVYFTFAVSGVGKDRGDAERTDPAPTG